MILVPHYVNQSEISGVGLFTARDIRSGEVVYKFDYRFVMVISEAEIKDMPAATQEAVRKYSYRGRGRERLTGAVYYCADDSRFFNHSDEPNTRWLEGEDVYVATRDIRAHTELTCDYNEFTEPGDRVLDDVVTGT